MATYFNIHGKVAFLKDGHDRDMAVFQRLGIQMNQAEIQILERVLQILFDQLSVGELAVFAVK